MEWSLRRAYAALERSCFRPSRTLRRNRRSVIDLSTRHRMTCSRPQSTPRAEVANTRSFQMFFAPRPYPSIRLRRASAALALGGVLLAGAVEAAIVPPGVQLAAKQELVRNNGTEVETLDPNVAESVPANTVARDLFEGLTATRADGETVPGVAEKWEMKDPTTWVFHLRRNAKWSNGEPVVAADFVYGCQRLVDPKIASPYASTFGIFLLNGAEIVAGKKSPDTLGVRAIDPYTVEIKTPYPVSFIPELMSNTNLGPVNKAAVDKYGKDWTKPGKLVSNGAFILKDWQVNNKLVLARNPQYWDAAHVQLSQVTYLPVESETSDIKLFQSGDNDWVYQLPSGMYPKYKHGRDLHVG